MSKDYAEQRAAILRDLDGLHYEVDPKKKVGFLWLDRPPLNVVSYRGRSQIAAIIEAFGQETGVPVVLNTSFNLKGEPIVATPADALSTFVRSGMDLLVLNDWIVQKA